DHRIVNALFDIRALLAEAADRNVDKIRFYTPQLMLADAHSLGAARPEVLHEHIGAGDQMLQHGESAMVLEIDRDRSLVAIDDREGRRNPALAGAHGAREVASPWRFYLDDVRAL